ncbi:MAG: hypothetical protein JSS27_11455 [Planctomycetes bacterium]|nr:hypothetical protein [Planctomycetota bacterium]
MRRLAICFLGMLILLGAGRSATAGVLRAGAAKADVSPRTLPAIRNGGFLEVVDDKVLDPLHARALVLDDGSERLAIVVVDSCMMPRELCDQAKALAAAGTKLRRERILISATHTHSAPSVMDFTLGARADRAYTEYLPGKIAEAIVEADRRLVPAEWGHTSFHAPNHTHCRRWIHQPDKIDVDPFGDRTVRAMMHPGYQNPAYVGPSGPVDDELSLLAIRSIDGAPIALLANYSMHYFGVGRGFSADYFGRFCDLVEARDGADAAARAKNAPAPVAIMSQGTSGDLHWMDYSQSKRAITIDEYASQVAALTLEARQRVEYRREVSLAMAERTIELGRRLPSPERLAWARPLNEARGERRPKDRPEVYAEQAVYLHEHPTETLVLQAARIGDVGITAIPNEVFSITGLKLKAQSPLLKTFNIELANGASGYIPPPEQHALGGYTTWPARTAGLEVQAEPKIVDTVLELLEQVSGQPRRKHEGDFYTPEMRAQMQAVLPLK